jgi:hypothetical protein
MFARVTTLPGPTEGERGTAAHRENVVPFVRENGGMGAMLMFEPDTGKALAITLWESEEAMLATEGPGRPITAMVADALGATQEPTVERYSVAVFEMT